MIPAMQEFNYQFGVDSYIRFGFDFSSITEQIKWARINFDEHVMPFSPSYPGADIRFYVNGLERSEGVPYEGQQPYLVIDKGTTSIVVELRTNGPYLEQLQLTSGSYSNLFDVYASSDGHGWVGNMYSMRYLSFVDISDGSGFTTLGRHGLNDMRNINTIVLPATTSYVGGASTFALTYINPYATITLKAKTPPATDGVLWRTLAASPSPYDNITLYVPKGCAQTYRQPTIQGVANDWSNIRNILELDY